jgi:hypothetical protein
MVAGSSSGASCFYYEPHGFHVSEVMLRQASASLKINRSNTACSSMPIQNSLRPRDFGAVHECDLFIG